MSITCFCLVVVSVFLLLPLQALSTRPLGVVVLGVKDTQKEEERVLLNLSDKIDYGTKWVKAKPSVLPLEENATLSSMKEQQKGNNIALDGKDNQDQETNVKGNKKDQEQFATKAEPLHVPTNPNDQSKMVKSKVHLSGTPNPKTVSWRLPQQKRKRRKKKKSRGSSHDPEFTLDYAPPRVHPPCHN